jgi:hypothetical protein
LHVETRHWFSIEIQLTAFTEVYGFYDDIFFLPEISEVILKNFKKASENETGDETIEKGETGGTVSHVLTLGKKRENLLVIRMERM